MTRDEYMRAWEEAPSGHAIIKMRSDADLMGIASHITDVAAIVDVYSGNTLIETVHVPFEELVHIRRGCFRQVVPPMFS
jgi:hypothetical protein